MHKKITMLLSVVAIIVTTGCTDFVLRTVMTTVDPYFHGEGIDGTELTKVEDHIYTFRWNWYRNLVIDTSEGWVVIDPMNPKMAKALKQALEKTIPGKRVHTLIYSHYHLDHTRGGAELSPMHVIAHEKSAQYWQALDNVTELLEPTRYISGDTVLNVGGVEIQAIYLGLSHTDTLYAFHIPSRRLVFTADVGLVKTMPPVGVPDRYAPGYIAAMDKIIKIDFDRFIPSHFGYGTRQDFIDWREMMMESRRLSYHAIHSNGTPGTEKDQMSKYFDAIYYPMREKYGDWHGFNEMFVLNMVRDVVGESLGY